MSPKPRLTVALLILTVLLLGTVAWAETEYVVFNGDFNTLPPGVSPTEALGKVPFGWVVSGGGTHWDIGLSDERALFGEHSLRVTVNAQGGGTHIASKPIPVEAGKTYAALWNVYNSLEHPTYTNGIHLYLEFWSDTWWGAEDYWTEESWAEGRRGAWTTANRVGVYWTQTSKFGEWIEMVVSGPAPAGAKYATISLWTANRTMNSFIDGVRFAALD